MIGRRAEGQGKGRQDARELIALAKAEGIELTDDQLEAVSGGWSLEDCISVCADNQNAGRECKLLGGHM